MSLTPTDSAAQVLDQSARLLGYLAAVAREIGPEPVRDVHKHEFTLWPADVPLHPAVLLGPTEQRTPWLQVRRVAAPDPVVVPKSLTSFVNLDSIRTPDDEPSLRADAVNAAILARHPHPDHNDAEGALSERAEVRRRELRSEIDKTFDDWLRTTWSPWADAARPDFAARDLYRRLHEVHLRAEAAQDQYEVVWGHAVASFRADTVTAIAPLLTVPVVIEMGERDGTISIRPERTVELELDAFEGIDLPGFDGLVRLAASLGQAPPDPWSDDEMQMVRHRLIAPLGVDATLADSAEPPQATAAPTINSGWVLMLRKRPLRQERFYNELADQIREERRVPDALASIVADKDLVDAALKSGGHDVDADDGTARRLLMPLPTNADQERIARQLAQSRGVTVQGPPGTGKSHTIVNLISHLVAQGKRVLVTAQNDQALLVLRDKIPAELRDLSIAVLGSTPAAMEELRSSAQSMQDSLSALDSERTKRRLAELGEQIDLAREELRRTDLELVEALRSEHREYQLPTGAARAPQVAQWIAAHRAMDTIVDRVPPDSNIPLTTGELTELDEISRAIEPWEADLSRMDLPVDEWLPTAQDLQWTFTRIDELQEAVTSLEARGLRVERVDTESRDQLERFAATAEQAAHDLNALAGRWETSFAQALVGRLPAAVFTADQNRQVRAKLAECREAQSRLAGHRVDVPDGDPTVQLQLLQEWSQRLSSGKKIPIFGARDLKEFSDHVRVDGFPVTAPVHIELAVWAVRLRSLLVEARWSMSSAYEAFGIPVPEPGPTFQLEAESVAERVDAVHRWWGETFPTLSALFIQLTTLPDPAGSPESLWQVAELLSGAVARLEERDLRTRTEELAAKIAERRAGDNPSDLWAMLASALSRRNVARWDQARTEADRLTGLKPLFQRQVSLASRLSEAGAPQWAHTLLTSSGAVVDPHDAAIAWTLAGARTWLASLHGEGDVSSLMQNAHTESERLRSLVIDLAASSARLRLKENTKDRHRRALEIWLTATRRAGKGTGKNAPRYIAEARAALPEAMGSVPVWIMPIYRVLENFDPRVSDPFDVVIVDESSQCDLLSLGVLALGKKSVVVGDDKQTSPQAVGVKTDRIFDLQSQFVHDLPDKTLLTMEESLYSISSRAFPSTILLREHFRCVPEIISFSNRYYNGKILPLREVTVPQIGAPLQVVHVKDGASRKVGSHRVNRREAEALVDQVAACAADPKYDGLSFGVVTMMSGSQANIIETMLVERLGIENYEKRNLRVGNPPVFQGDERNVVFISVVADDNSFAATRSMHEQWANVAASRAQDQLWVFHTVDPTTLHHDDQRRHLIEHMRNVSQIEEQQDLYDLTESKFERDVLTQILERGYEVTPQHRVGNYRIDFVVKLGEGERLAIECDGDSFHGPDKWDEDVRRQRVLERLGWNFWRIRASAYYLDPNAAMQPLWVRLEGIKQQVLERAARRRARDEQIAAEQLARIEQKVEVARRGQVPPETDAPAIEEPSATEELSRSASEPTATPSEIRRWARANGIPVGDRGRLAPDVVQAYHSARAPS